MHEVIRLERCVAGGEVLGRDSEGRVVLVRNGLVSELVRVEQTEHHGSWWRAEVTEVLEAAPTRVEASCPSRRAGCGGCDWMHLASAAQLDTKIAVVAETLSRMAGIDEIAPVAGGSVPPYGYRTTARVVGTADRRAGFRRERSHDTVSAAPCEVVHPALREIIAAVSLTPDAEAELRISAATGDATARIIDERGSVPGLIDVPDRVRLGDAESLVEIVAGVELRVSAASFFQSGPAAAELLIANVVALAPELERAETVLDAYGGVGMFAATVVPARAHRLVIESSRSAAHDARRNLEGLPGEVRRQRFEHWRHRGAPLDVAIADPARTGLKRGGVNALVSAGADVVVLVSCDVAAGARDLVLLREAGYRLEAVRVLDLFAQTHHLEMVSRLVRTTPKR